MSLAFVFPGQGSQSIGMLDAMATEYSIVKETFQQASEALAQDLWAIVSAGPQETLNQTENTQPAMLAAGVAVWRVWQERGGEQPVMMAGHSLGEYTALVCAGSLDFTDAITLVRDRGQFMQSAVPAGQGAMAAILGLKDDAVRGLCEQVAEGDVLSAVNFNSPGQVVIAGTAAAVERAVAQASEAGAKRAVTLPVSVPSHCALMHPAAENMAKRLAEVTIHPPGIRVVHNADVFIHDEADAIRAVLVQQIEQPVRWVESVQHLVANGVDRIIECGPGRVLMGLNKRITKDAKTVAVYDPSSLDKALAEGVF
ncbi:MAG: ACP S-malonyltransferase [Gammaproteobacteria bacterium]|nr:MAG: ACP S-malonyltransferase [Gammaproteobacteria bacterium]